MAYLFEQAGGAATNGVDRILDIEPKALHDRTPLVLGSKHEVNAYREFMLGEVKRATAQLHARRVGAPHVLVHLELHADRQASSSTQATSCRGASLPKTVLASRFGVRSREGAFAHGRAHPLVVGAVGEHELDLVARADVLEVAPAVAVRLAAARALEVHDLVDARVDAGHVGLAARLDEHRAARVAQLAPSAERRRAAGAARRR